MSYQFYADIIIDISHENLDKTYQYAIPGELKENAVIGALVIVPFGKGNRKVQGYIVDISAESKIDQSLIKPIAEVVKAAQVIESHLIFLAYWMKETFGGTMNEALKTVIPVKKAVKIKEQKNIELTASKDQAHQLLYEYQRKNNKAKLRLLEALLRNQKLDYGEAIGRLNISRSTILAMEKQGIARTVSRQLYRNPIELNQENRKHIELNEEQRNITEDFLQEYESGVRGTYLIHGITGSGKTEVYMEIIASVITQGKQVIVLIPEIALTWQTVKRFYARFGERISIMNSKMSQGERYDQSLRAKNGELDIIIGPRSALFTPFQNLGLIIIDEEHEGSYKSESSPKYHAVPVAEKRAQLTNSSVILGSATPSLESYLRAKNNDIKLYRLTERAKEAAPPKVYVVDLREELKNKNKSIFSGRLRDLITQRLDRKEQIMLFLNRRGYAGFVSCRSCGYVMKCSHCDVSLTSHNDQRLICHYCGHEEMKPVTCPSCGSKYIAAFGTGTQKVEEMVIKEFPTARVLRMDMDTTKNKGGHESILKAFSEHKADILVGTQMIVKGHDFPRVTLVGILAADLSLYTGDFRSGERTFQLLCQASGRAGRDALPGEVVIQTYHPEHYSILAAAEGNYESFFEQELLFRSLMKYPPASHMLLILVTSKEEEQAEKTLEHLSQVIRLYFEQHMLVLEMIGPAPAAVSKVNDTYRRVIYIKQAEYTVLMDVKNYLEGYFAYSQNFSGCNLLFDFDPMTSY